MLNSNRGVNVLSLFDGISCGRLAFDRAGIPVANYWASEINNQSIKCSKANWPSIKHLGDVKKVRATQMEKIDFLIGGSPCQGFSYAGKMLNFNDPNSVLFFEYVRILKEVREKNPDVIFLLENVNMKRSFLKVISDHLGIQPVKINSSRLCPQNRPRYYWTNINAYPVDLFGTLKGNIPQPNRRAPKFLDILEPTVDDKYFLPESYVKKYLIKAKNLDIQSLPEIGAAKFGRSDECKEIRREHIKQTGKDYSPYGKKEVVRVDTNLMNCVTASSARDNIVFFRKIEASGSRFTIPENRLFKNGPWKGCGFRRLSQRELERLQTMPDDYTKVMSYSAATEALGNGWTVDVIVHILNQIK